MFEFTIQIAPKDFLNTHLCIEKRIKKKIVEKQIGDVYWLILLSLIVMLGIAFKSLYLQDPKNQEDVIITVITLFVLVAFYLIWGKYSALVFIENQISKKGITLGDWQMKIDEKGIAQTKPFCQLFYGWKTIIEIEEGKEYFYLFIDAANAIILPVNQMPEYLEAYILKQMANVNP